MLKGYKMIKIKAKHEIEIMKQAGKIVAETFEVLREHVKPGVSTLELDAVAERYIKKCGATCSFKGYGGFPGSICTSINDRVVHGIPSKHEILQEGDIISLDIGACYKGYHGDSAKTFPVGKISAEAQRLIDVTRESFYRGIAQAKPDNRIIDISTAVQQYVEANNCSVVRDLVGHGVGSELHEAPEVPNFASKAARARLVPGMTIAVEPMVNAGGYQVRTLADQWTVVTADGSLSAHYEHSIVITNDGCEILTKC